MENRKLTEKEKLLLESIETYNNEPTPNDWLLRDDQARARRMAQKGILEIRWLASSCRPNVGVLAYSAKK